jgi:hypothetical protein
MIFKVTPLCISAVSYENLRRRNHFRLNRNPTARQIAFENSENRLDLVAFWRFHAYACRALIKRHYQQAAVAGVAFAHEMHERR